MIHIKFYDYSGIDISGLKTGDLLIVRGILQKNDTTSPYNSGYFVRLRQQQDIVKRSENPRRTVYIHLDAFRNDYIGRTGWDTSTLESLINDAIISGVLDMFFIRKSTSLVGLLSKPLML